MVLSAPKVFVENSSGIFNNTIPKNKRHIGVRTRLIHQKKADNETMKESRENPHRAI